MSKIELPPDPAGTCEVDCGPDAATGGLVVCYEDGYSADQMREYGKACARAALERAAQICDEINRESGGGWETFGEAIRAEIERV